MPAPGEAASPRATSPRCSPLSWGCSSCSRCSGVTRVTASAWVREISGSVVISTAMRSAARPVRLPVRVWSIHSLPCSMVNSVSSMSR